MANVTKYSTKSGVRYRVRYRKPDGTQTDKRGFRRKIDAENWAAEHVTVAKATGTYIDPTDGKITVEALAGSWLAKKKISCKASYYRTLESTWSIWVKPTWGKTPVANVTRADAQQWITLMQDGVKNKQPNSDGSFDWIIKPRSASVIRRAHDILAGILDDAVADHRIPSNPVRQLELPRKRARRHIYLTVQQLVRLADNAKWRHDLILVLGLCGMRWGELVPIRVRDVDLKQHRIYIGVSAPMVGGVLMPDDTKTYEARTIMYPSILDPIMHQRCDGRGGDAYLFEAPGRPGEMIREWGNAGTGDGWLLTARRHAGIDEPLRIHDLRHTAASIMVHAGANVKAVQRQLGHRNAAMTLDVYADLFDDDLDNLSTAISEMIVKENVGKMWANEIIEAS